MQDKLLKEIISNIAGEGSEKIVDLLFKKKNVNEFLIAKRLELTINQTRNILYKLSDHGLVSFIRKKDSKKGGWYTYFWTLSVHKSLELLRTRIQEKSKKLGEEINRRKQDRFYYSPGANIEYTEEQALEHDFICPETGDVMELRNNSSFLEDLNKEKESLEKILVVINGEMEIIEKKEKQVKERRLKKEAKEKEEERKKRREKLKKIRMKEAKKLGKKVGKKKPKKKVKKKTKKVGKKKVKKNKKPIKKNKGKKKVKKNKKPIKKNKGKKK